MGWMQMASKPVDYVVVGGGVAGVCCAQELKRVARPDDVVSLVTASRTVKRVFTVNQYTRKVEEVQVEDMPVEELEAAGIRVVSGVAEGLDTQGKAVLLSDGRQVPYDKLAVCSGARPRPAADSPHVHMLRDVESVQQLAARLSKAFRVMVVGNGGIALELVSALRGVQVVWSLKHGHIGDAFFDLDAAAFLLTEMAQHQERLDRESSAAALEGQLGPDDGRGSGGPGSSPAEARRV